MLGTILRLFWRVLIGSVSILLAYATVFIFYPYLDDHLPLLINLIILYLIIAYIGIPSLIRLWHLVLRPRYLPHYAVSRDGWSSDPVNIAIVCKNEAQLQKAMQESGWHMADKATLKNSFREGMALLLNRSYPTAPFSNLYLFGRRQDIGFQIQTGHPPTPRHRHHVRFWQLEGEPTKPHQHYGFWEGILQLFPGTKKQIWIGTATHDISPFALRIQNLQLTHKIDAETNKERDFLIQTLNDTGLVKRCDTLQAGDPVSFRGQTFGLNIVTDGTLRVVELRR